MRPFWRRRTHEDFSDEVQRASRSRDRAPDRRRHESPTDARGAAPEGVRQRHGASRSASTSRAAGCGSSSSSQDLRYALRAACAQQPGVPGDHGAHARGRSRAASRSRSRSSTPTCCVPSRCSDPGSAPSHRVARARRRRPAASGGATTRSCASAAICSTPSSREDTRFVSSERPPARRRPSSPTTTSRRSAPRLLARPRARRRRRARARRRAQPPGLGAAVRGRSGRARPRARSRRPAVRDRRRAAPGVHRPRRVPARRLDAARHLRRLPARPAGPGPAARIEITARLRRGRDRRPTPRRADAVHGADGRPAARRRDELRAELRPHATPNPLSLELLAVLVAGLCRVRPRARHGVRERVERDAGARRSRATARSPSASRSARAARRIVRQLLTEGLLIAVLAGAAGAGAGGVDAARRHWSRCSARCRRRWRRMLRVVPLTFDYRVFLFALGVAGADHARVRAAAGAAGVAAAADRRAARPAQRHALRRRGCGARSSSAQVAVSLVLVVVALTLARNFASLGAIDLGYQTRGVYSVNVRGERATGCVPRWRRRSAADPRVGRGGGHRRQSAVHPSRATSPRRRPPAPRRPATRYTFVSPEYFSILRMPIVRGRAFRADEARAAARVAIVSDATARAFWPGRRSRSGRPSASSGPKGRPVDELPGYTEVTVVGTVTDVVSGMIVDGQDAGHIYLPTHARDPHAVAVLLRAARSERLPPRGAARDLPARRRRIRRCSR